jgi:hypothetical protein
MDDGRSLWPAGLLAERHAALETLTPGSAEHCTLAAAVATQEATLGVRQTNAAIREALAVPATTAADTAIAAVRALVHALRGVAHVGHLHFHPGRVAELAHRRRATARAMDVAVNKVLQFVAPPPGWVPDGRLPVIYVGDWIKDKATAGAFPKKRFFAHLAKRAIVIVCGEYRTTKRCGDCGCVVRHPLKPDKRTPFKGTVYCANTHCPSGGRFRNRDAAAACNIVNRFLCGFYVGGSLGCFADSAPVHAPRISLSGTLRPAPVRAWWVGYVVRGVGGM